MVFSTDTSPPSTRTFAANGCSLTDMPSNQLGPFLPRRTEATKMNDSRSANTRIHEPPNRGRMPEAAAVGVLQENRNEVLDAQPNNKGSTAHGPIAERKFHNILRSKLVGG